MFPIMSHVPVPTISTTPPVTVLCSGASPLTMTVVMAPFSVGVTTLSQQDVVMLPQFILRDTFRVSVGLTTVLEQQPQSQMPSGAYTNYAMGPSQVSFLFQS